MSQNPGYHNRQLALAATIRGMLCELDPSTYNEIAPNIAYWIEYGITEEFVATDDLVERISPMAWGGYGSHSDISRFLKEFRDAPHRSDQARSFVDKLCLHVLRWFAIASVEGIEIGSRWSNVSPDGSYGFICAASFVGHLIESGLLGHDLVRRYLVTPLIAHHYASGYHHLKTAKANAIYQLFIAAGNTLLQGVLEPGDVQVCFKTLDSQIALGKIVELDATRLNELRGIHAGWLQRKAEEEQRNATTAEVPTGEVDTPVAFVPENLPAATTDTNVPSSILRSIVPPPILQDAEYPTETFFDIPATAASSPTLSISTVSDLASTEFGEDTGEGSDERIPPRHEAFYLEDGNIEIACGHTIFRVHSPIVSFSSPNLRDMLSPSTLLNAPMPGGCPRIVFKDSAEDFAVLLKMIYTPGFPAWRKVPEFAVFASLLRMTIKYGFSDVRDQLVDSIKGAYPTKWEGPGTTTVLGEDIFGSPEPHPNAVLNLFSEQNIRFALPFAAYRAALGGFSSLTSEKPGTILPRPALASTIYGMELIRGGLAQLAHSVVSTISLERCHDDACALNVGINPPGRRVAALERIYDVMIKGGKGDVLFSLPLGDIVCVNCAKTLEQVYHLWCTTTWAELPRIFGVGRSWEEV